MKKFLNKLFGYRWSLYLTDKNKNIYYYLHSDRVISLIFSVAYHFVKNGDPKEPWCIYLNFNKTHTDFKLTEDYFTKGTQRITITKKLLDKLKSIDPNYDILYRPKYKPIYAVDAINNKRILFEPNIDFNNSSEILNTIFDNEREKTFTDVLIAVFKK